MKHQKIKILSLCIIAICCCFLTACGKEESFKDAKPTETINISTFEGEWTIPDNQGVFKISENNWQCYNKDGNLYDEGTVKLNNDKKYLELLNNDQKVVATVTKDNNNLKMNLQEKLSQAFGNTITCSKKNTNPSSQATPEDSQSAVTNSDNSNITHNPKTADNSNDTIDIPMFEGEWTIPDNQGIFKISKDSWQCYNDTNHLYSEGTIKLNTTKGYLELYNEQNTLVAKVLIEDNQIKMTLEEELYEAFGSNLTCQSAK